MGTVRLVKPQVYDNYNNNNNIINNNYVYYYMPMSKTDIKTDVFYNLLG